MKFCISLGQFSIKYFFYIVLFVFLDIFSYFFLKDTENIVYKHYLLDSVCFFLGYLLNIVPAWIISINYNNTNSNYKNLSIKEIIKFFSICVLLILADFIIYFIKIRSKNENNDNNEKFLFIEILITFLILKYNKEIYYKHQNISFAILILVEIIKTIYFFIRSSYEISIITIISRTIYSILYAFYYLYIQKLMKYNFISPYKCNFMIGVVDLPLIIIIYFIISFTILGNNKYDYYFDNIFELFEDIRTLDTKNSIFLILYPFIFGIVELLISKIIYDFTIYHIFIPQLLVKFIENISKDLGIFDNIFLISSYIIDFIMILIFVEIIEVNFCGLEENLKKNIELRGINEDNYEEFDDRNTINNNKEIK